MNSGIASFELTCDLLIVSSMQQVQRRNARCSGILGTCNTFSHDTIVHLLPLQQLLNSRYSLAISIAICQIYKLQA